MAEPFPDLERVQMKWGPVARPATQQTKDSVHYEGSKQRHFALGPAARVARGTYGAAVVLGMSCITLLVYFALTTFTDDWTSLPGGLDARQELTSDRARRPPSAPALDPRQADILIAALMDDMDATIAQGSSGGGTNDAVAILDRISKLVAAASPNGLKIVLAMPDRFAAKALEALAEGRIDEARRLEQFSQSLAIALPTPASRLQAAVTGAELPQQLDAIAVLPGGGVKSDQIPPPSRSSGTSVPGVLGDDFDRAASDQEAAVPRQPPHSGGDTKPVNLSGEAVSSARPVVSPTAAAPVGSITGPEQKVDAARQASVALAAPSPPGFSSPAAGQLPALAPVRVVLIFAREDLARANRAADIQKALAAAGVAVAGLVAADSQQSRPAIGYYFHPDRGAAAGVSRTLEPLLGTVVPAVLRLGGGLPQPGTIEVAVP